MAEPVGNPQSCALQPPRWGGCSVVSGGCCLERVVKCVQLQPLQSHSQVPGLWAAAEKMSWLQRRAWAGGRRWPSLRPFIALCGHDILLRVISLLSFHPWFPLLANSKPEPQNKGDSGKHRSRHPRWGFGFYSHGKESPLTFTTPEPTMKNIGSSLPFTSASSLPYSFYISLLLTQFLSPKSFKFPFFW